MNISGSYETTEHRRYTEYTVDAGSTLVVTLDEGDVFEDAVINVQADGAGVQMYTYPNRYDAKSPIQSCAIRNVGVRGEVPVGNGPVVLTGVSGEAIVENVYLGDGSAGTDPHDGSAAFYGVEGHLGSMDLRAIYVAGFTANAFYLPGRPSNRNDTYDGSGSYHWRDCYVEDCEVAAYRVGDQSSTHTMDDCHADLSENVARGVWNWDSTIDIEDSEIVGGENGGVDDHNGGHVHFTGDVQIGGGVECNYSGTYNTNPSPAVPTNCPTTAVEAARGNASTEPSPAPNDPGDRDHILLVSGENRGTTSAAQYRIQTTGPIEAGEYEDPEFSSDQITAYDTYYEVVWEIADWRDSWAFDGDLFNVQCDDPAVDFELDGSAIDPSSDQYSQEPPEDTGGPPSDPGDPPSTDPSYTEQVSVPAGESRQVTIAVDPDDL